MIFEHTATWAAVLGAIAYGTGDFLGGCASRRLTTFSVVAIAQGVAVAFLLQNYAFAQRALPAGASGWMSVTAGIAYAIGVISMYEGLAHGRIAVVASICALLSILVPLAGDLALGRNISRNEFIGMVLCAAATLLVVRAAGFSDRRSIGWSVRVGATAGIAFGAGDIGLGAMPPELAPGAMLIARCVAATIAVALALGPALLLSSKAAAGSLPAPPAALTVAMDVSAPTRTPRQFIPLSAGLMISIALSVGAGLLDTLGHVGYVHAATRGSMGVAAALVAIFPAVTVLLAATLLRERITRAQIVGFGLGAGGIVFIAG